MEIRDNNGQNPLIVISPDEVRAWLRQKADEAGYADRKTCVVQAAFRDTSDGRPIFQWSPPELMLMVSNIQGQDVTVERNPDKQADFDPVGEIKNLSQIISELRIAGQRMEIQAGVMKQWSQRFTAFADALSGKQRSET